MNNLNLGKCPKCGDDLEFNGVLNEYVCNHVYKSIDGEGALVETRCDFNITEEDYDSYVNQLRENEYHENTADENLEYLNSL